MNKLIEIFRKHQITALVVGVVILFFLVAAIFLLRTPRFPAEDTINKNRQAAFQERQAFFQAFSHYLRDNHGGLLSSGPVKIPDTAEQGKDSASAQFFFKQQFQFLNQSLISELAEEFARKNGMKTIIRLDCQSYKTKRTCHELDFKKGDRIWISILLEFVQPEYPEKGKKSEYMDRVDPNSQAKEMKNGRKKARLAIVIDDLGYRMDVFNNLITLEYDITYAVLPQQAYSQETAEIATHAGRQVMLHLPMQPKDWPRFDPGLGALLINDSPEEIRAKIDLNLQTVPYVGGVNNHMGSAYTQYAEGLDIVMQSLSEKKLFFLDSKTSPGKIARNAATRHQVPYLSRDIFLDNDRVEMLVERQLHKAARLAKKRGWAVAIGHPYDVTFTVLAKQLPKLEAQGITITKVIDLIN